MKWRCIRGGRSPSDHVRNRTGDPLFALAGQRTALDYIVNMWHTSADVHVDLYMMFQAIDEIQVQCNIRERYRLFDGVEPLDIQYQRMHSGKIILLVLPL